MAAVVLTPTLLSRRNPKLEAKSVSFYFYFLAKKWDPAARKINKKLVIE